MSAVSDLLVASHEAHRTALLLRQRRDAASADHLTRARDLRLEALAADPSRTDPAWVDEKPSHAALMAFYAKQLNG